MAGRHRKTPPVTPGRHRKPPRRGHVVLPSLAVAAVLGIGGVSAGAVLGGDSHHAAPSLTRPVPAGAVTSAPASPPSPSPSAPAAAPASPAALPDFAVTVTGRLSWVSVVGPHGRVLFAGMLRHGKTLSYRQRPLTVTLGDAGAVRLVMHHHPAKGPAGRPGAVLRFTYR